jgi:hypothetical protein
MSFHHHITRPHQRLGHRLLQRQRLPGRPGRVEGCVAKRGAAGDQRAVVQSFPISLMVVLKRIAGRG